MTDDGAGDETTKAAAPDAPPRAEDEATLLTTAQFGTCANCEAPYVAPSQHFCTRCGTPRRTGITPDQRRALVIGGAILGVIILVIALSTSGGNSNSPVNSTLDTAITGPDTTPTTDFTTTTQVFTNSGVSSPVGSWTISGQGTNGYTATAVLDVGKPEHSSGISGLPTACTVDPNTDGVIPAHVRVTNTTAGFPTAVAINLYAQLSGSSAFGVAGAAHHTDGDACRETSDTSNFIYGAVSTSPTQPNTAAFAEDFYIILRNYFTPNAPQGDNSLYNSVRLYASVGFDSTNTNVDNSPTVTGPGVVNGGGGTSGSSTFPLTG